MMKTSEGHILISIPIRMTKSDAGYDVVINRSQYRIKRVVVEDSPGVVLWYEPHYSGQYFASLKRAMESLVAGYARGQQSKLDFTIDAYRLPSFAEDGA